jgi:hypothetical protein
MDPGRAMKQRLSLHRGVLQTIGVRASQLVNCFWQIVDNPWGR